MIKYLLTGIYVLFTTGGLVCLKLGGNSLGLSRAEDARTVILLSW